MNRPEPNYPKRSVSGRLRHAKKKVVRHAFMDPTPRSKPKGGRS